MPADGPTGMLAHAVRAAMGSGCKLSKRGVVIWTCAGGELVSRGTNGPPRGWQCDGTPECKAACGRTCLHAEERALIALGSRDYGDALEILHVKIADGEPVPSGPPSCIGCAAKILDNRRVRWVWLLHDDGLRRYRAEEFYRLSREHHGL